MDPLDPVSSSGIRNLGSGLSLCLTSYGHALLDSEPQLPHLATSCGWEKEENVYAEIEGLHTGHSVLPWCPPLGLHPFSTLLWILDGFHYLDG